MGSTPAATDATNDAGEPIVVVDVTDRVMTIRLNRPERLNGLGKAMRTGVSTALDLADADDEVRCVVLTGTGRAFSSGADLQDGGMGPTGGGAQLETRPRRLGSVYDWFRFGDSAYGPGARVDTRAMQKPVIAAVNGLAYGAGLITTTTCDITVAAESARFSMIEARMGNSGGSNLPFLVGPQWAKYLMFTGDIISARRAKEIGLILEVIPDADFEERVAKLAQRIAAMPRIATMLEKRQMNGTMDMMGWTANRTFSHSHEAIINAMAEYAEASDGRMLRDIFANEGFKAFKEARDAPHAEPWLAD
jgi:2-(1,2-epoxy-1,2-dihydrophenyl)acetyl-CoA isomerase